MALTYRREIDGLRAVAVGAVVLYHAGLGGAGYGGVDVFFVISGYLITALLLREKYHTGRIDLADFYARRVRRIFPAGIAVILAVLAVVPILPEPAKQGVIQSAAAAAVFGANVYFQFATGGYFTGDAGQFPLLHLWSLSVEEQFYLLWPALLLFARSRAAFAIIAVASFALCEWLLIGHPSAAFYQMPARAWELAAGAFIAASPVKALPRWTLWAGLALTLAACIVPLPHFPGWGALPAVAGAALVLWAIHGGATNRLLASRPFVGVGLISYSLYLWHWPLLAIDRLMRVGPSPWDVRAALVAAAVILAIASYRYIETPLRKPWGSSRRTVAIGFASMALLSCGAWAWRAPEPAKVTVQHRRCFGPMQSPNCLAPGPKVVLWGDSSAHSWTPIAITLAQRAHLQATQFARDGCPPLIGPGLRSRSEDERAACQAFNAQAVAYIARGGADTVVMAGYWQNFITPDNGAALVRAVDAIAPHVQRIVIVGPTPVLPDTITKCAALRASCAVERSAFDADALTSTQAMALVASRPKVDVIAAADWLCDGPVCQGFRNGAPLYVDNYHIALSAATEYAALVR